MTMRTAPSPVAPTSLQSSRTDDFAVTPLQLPSHEVATLFRGASVAVKLLSEYGGYVAHSHVREVLQEDLMAVLADTGSYELNPNKLQPGGEHDNDVEASRNRIVAACESILNKVIDACDSAPAEFRQLFASFASETAHCFGNAVGFNAALSALFLRFYCPAVVKPFEYGIVDSNDCPADRLTALIYCAKLLQSLANNQLFNSKEEHMRALNPFIQHNENRIRSFFARFIGCPAPGIVLASLEPDYDPAQYSQDRGERSKGDGDDNDDNDDDDDDGGLGGGAKGAGGTGIAFNTSTEHLVMISLPQVAGGFLLIPTPTAFDMSKADQLIKGDGQSDGVFQIKVLEAAGQLRQRLSSSFARMYLYSKTKKMDKASAGSTTAATVAGDESAISPGEVRAAELLMMQPGLLDEISAVLDEKFIDEKSSLRIKKPKAPSSTRDLQFLKILIRPDMLVGAAVCEMIKFSEANPIVAALGTIFNVFNIMSNLVDHNIRRELMLTYRKWQVPKDANTGTILGSAISFEASVAVKTTSLFMLSRWTPLFMVYNKGTLSYFSSRQSYAKDDKPKNVQSATDLVSVRPSIIGDPTNTILRVETKAREYFVKCETHASMRQLVDKLNTVMAEFVSTPVEQPLTRTPRLKAENNLNILANRLSLILSPTTLATGTDSAFASA